MRTLLALTLVVLSMPASAVASVASEARDAAVKAGFASISDRVAKAAEPALRFAPVLRATPRALGTSRFGGDPDLPADELWPSCKGRAQTFLMQLRLADLPREAADLRRLGGRLLFFTHVEFEDPTDTTYGMWAGDCTAVLHVPARRALRRRTPPRGGPVKRLRQATVKPHLHADVPDTVLDQRRLGPPLRDIVLPDDPAQDRWWNMRAELRGPRTTFLEHRALGFMDSPNGGDRCYERTQRSTRTWRHLLTFASDHQLRFEVADAGRLQVAISPADLRAGRFDRICGIFDSA